MKEGRKGDKSPPVQLVHHLCLLFFVFRGCSAQYSFLLDSHWSSVVDALDNLVALHIRTEAGIMSVIKQLDSKLSDAIMKAMLMGQDLQTKVSGGERDKGKGKGTS